MMGKLQGKNGFNKANMVSVDGLTIPALTNFFFTRERTVHFYSVRTAKVKIKQYVALTYLGGETTGSSEL